MIKSFKDKDCAAVFAGRAPVRLRALEAQLVKRLQILDSASDVSDLAGLPSNRFEALKGNRAGQFSIGVNRQWRLCFRFDGQDAVDVGLVDYH
jgi:proteic killer suppression protein